MKFIAGSPTEKQFPLPRHPSEKGAGQDTAGRQKWCGHQQRRHGRQIVFCEPAPREWVKMVPPCQPRTPDRSASLKMAPFVLTLHYNFRIIPL